MRWRGSSQGETDAPLACPRCDARYPEGARFCERCRLPLVIEVPDAPPAPVSRQHRQARKIKPQYSEGPLRHLLQVPNQVEGEFIQSLLLEEGIPSLMRRSAGFDVPDFLAAG